MIRVRILGISATPIKDGNCDTMVREALKACAELGNVDTEFVTSAGKEIAICEHCQWCIENMAPCKIKDDASIIYNKMTECDGLILATPVWLNTISPFLLNLFSRTRYYVFFTHQFRNKAVALLTLGFLGYGLDNAISVMKDVVLAMNMIPVATARAIASGRVFGRRPDYLEHGVLDDSFGILQARQASYRVVELARMIKYATENGITIPDDYKFTVTGGRVRPPEEKIFIKGTWREQA